MKREIILGTLAVITLVTALICWKTNTKVTRIEKLEHPDRIKIRV